MSQRIRIARSAFLGQAEISCGQTSVVNHSPSKTQQRMLMGLARPKAPAVNIKTQQGKRKQDRPRQGGLKSFI